MNTLFKWLGKKKTDVNAGVRVTADGVSAVSIRWRNDRPQLLHCAHRSVQGDDGADSLKQVIREAQLERSPIATVMPLGSYHLLLIEAPEVPAPELRAAVRWRIRDLIDFHIDDAVLDVFDAPPAGARTTHTHLYVVVTRSNEVKALADRLQDAGLDLNIIDIPELALRNIAARLPENEQGVAMLHFDDQRGVIALCRNNTLYLARTLDIGQQRLQEAAVDGQLEAVFDALALEIQRSLDYYDRHFQQAAITHVRVTPLAGEIPSLTQSLKTNLGIDARFLDLADVIDGTEGIPAEQVSHLVLALGAALRSEHKTL